MNAKENPMQKIIARCWEDEAFKKRLMADPAATLKAEGMEVPKGITVNVVEDTEQVRTLVIPTMPQVLSDDALTTAVGGVDGSGGWWCSINWLW